MKTGLKAWVKQRSKDITEKGSKKAPWIVFWNDPNGRRKEKSCGPGRDGWRLAQKEKQRIHGQLISGTYQERTNKTWEAFRKQYREDHLTTLAARSRAEIEHSLDHFERIAKPGKTEAIDAQAIETYVSKRRKENGLRGDPLSPATVNKELRHIKAALNQGRRWKYLAVVPEIKFLKEMERIPQYMTAEHFEMLYNGCHHAAKPKQLPYEPGEWWRALLVTLFMTGWRIGETLALRWQDVDLEAGTARLRAETTKGKRDEIVQLHPVVVEHLERIRSFNRLVFPWQYAERTLWKVFYRIQKAAGILLPIDDHECEDDYCDDVRHFYGFHDERRAFATLNAANLTGPQLQALMRHKSYATTQRYVNMAKQMDGVTAVLHVPRNLVASGGLTK